MAVETPVRNSEGEGENARGLLFRLSARVGVIVFVAVLTVAVNSGLDPTLALIRALVSLLAVTACGWLAEQIALKAWQDQPATESSGELEDESGETQRDE